MYKKTKQTKTSIKRNESYVGETIEAKVRRIVNNKEPITDGAPLIYTERKEGVNPAYDIRTDRFEIAVDSMEKVVENHITKRNEKIKKFEEKLDKENKQNEGGTQPIQGTDPSGTNS